MVKRIKVMVAKPGLDGHDRGAKVIARTFRDAGMEVVYTGLHQSPLKIVSAAVEEDVDVIAVSILSGAHLPLCEKIIRELERQGAKDDKILIVGGTIVEEDVAALKEMGVAEVFPPGSPLDAGVRYIKGAFEQGPEADD